MALQLVHDLTGERNPVQFRMIYDVGREYFTRNPMRDKQGKLIPQPEWTFPEPAAYRRNAPGTSPQWTM